MSTSSTFRLTDEHVAYGERDATTAGAGGLRSGGLRSGDLRSGGLRSGDYRLSPEEAVASAEFEAFASGSEYAEMRSPSTRPGAGSEKSPTSGMSLSSNYSGSTHASSADRNAWAADSSPLRKSLTQLATMVANITEAYSAVIFTAHPSGEYLKVEGVHTLSRDFVYDVKIHAGSGLVGWTAENAVRISVCPFEHDARTLLYYSSDQALKSFIAVPILDEKNGLLGVVACDSRKSYAFAKMTEKLLVDCAAQAATLIELHVKAARPALVRSNDVEADTVAPYIEQLRAQISESSLLTLVSEMPTAIANRDSLVVVSLASGGVGEGAFYTTSTNEKLSTRLLDAVTRHKKIICGDRSVHSLPADDGQQRSFLSIPVHVLGREAGSLNLLSRPNEAFDALTINRLEQIGVIVSKELEYLRLRAEFASPREALGMTSWKQLELYAKERLKNAKATRDTLCLLRIRFAAMADLEREFGIGVAAAVLRSSMRLIDQLRRNDGIACYLYGTEIMLMMDSREAGPLVSRFRHLLERGQWAEQEPGILAVAQAAGGKLARNLEVGSAFYPRDGETLEQLSEKAVSRVQLLAKV